MSPGHCSCPECGTTLRVRDRSFIGRQIECPECHAKLQIGQDQDRKLVAQQVKVEPVRKPVASLASSKAIRAGSALGAKLRGLLHSPLVLAWALAIGLTAFVAILMLRPSVRLRAPAKESPPVDIANDAEPNQVPPAAPEQPPPEEPADAAPADVVVKPSEPYMPPKAEMTAPSNPGPTPTETASTTPPGNSPSTEQPAEVRPTKPAPPVPVVIDVESLLKQRLQKFSTGQPVSRTELIELVEEMLGAPIRYNREELGEKNLDRPVSIDLETTTVGGVLKALLEPAGWDYVIENNGIKLKPRQVAGNS